VLHAASAPRVGTNIKTSCRCDVIVSATRGCTDSVHYSTTGKLFGRWPERAAPEAAGRLARRLQRVGVQHGGARRRDAPDPLRAVHDRLEVLRRAAAPHPGARTCPLSRMAAVLPLIGVAFASTLRFDPMTHSQEDWDVEFAKYKSSPEYMKVNRNMTLEVRCPASITSMTQDPWHMLSPRKQELCGD